MEVIASFTCAASYKKDLTFSQYLGKNENKS